MYEHARMLESHDHNDWHEDHADELVRQGLTARSNHSVIRMGYPLRARLVKKCLFTAAPVGHVFRYARTQWAPSAYPIQVWDVDGKGMPHQWCYTSDEVELLPAED